MRRHRLWPARPGDRRRAKRGEKLETLRQSGRRLDEVETGGFTRPQRQQHEGDHAGAREQAGREPRPRRAARRQQADERRRADQPDSVERAAIGANRQGKARDQRQAERPGMGEDDATARARRQGGAVEREGETGQGHLHDEMQFGGLRKIGQAAEGQDEAPDRGADEARNREPRPLPQAGEAIARRGDDADIDQQRPGARLGGIDQQRRGERADEAEARDGRAVPVSGEQGRESGGAERDEGGARADEAVKRISGVDRAEAGGGAGGGQHRRGRRRLARASFAPAQELARAGQSRRQRQPEQDAGGGAEQALFEGVAHQQQAAERQREAADIDHPARSDGFFQRGAAARGRRRGRGLFGRRRLCERLLRRRGLRDGFGFGRVGRRRMRRGAGRKGAQRLQFGLQRAQGPLHAVHPAARVQRQEEAEGAKEREKAAEETHEPPSARKNFGAIIAAAAFPFVTNAGKSGRQTGCCTSGPSLADAANQA